MTITNPLALAAVIIAGLGLLWTVLSWLIGKLSDLRREDREDLKGFVSTAVDTLTQSIDGVKDEVGGLRVDLHSVSDRTVDHEARLKVLERYDVVTKPTPARKSARRKSS